MTNYNDLFEYNLGSVVYLKTDREQSPRIITAIQINPNGVIFRLGCGTTDSWHFSVEISSDVDVLIKTNN